MEAIHQIILESVSGGFWRFVGYAMMCVIIFVLPFAAAATILESVLKGKYD